MYNDDRFHNFVLGIKDAIAGAAVFAEAQKRMVGYAEGLDAARDVSFDPEDFDAADLFDRYFA